MSKRKKQVYACVITIVGIVLVRELTTSAGPAVVLGAPKAASRRAPSAEAQPAHQANNAGAYVLVPARFPPNLPQHSAVNRDVFDLSSVAKEALLHDPEELDATGGPANRAEHAKQDVTVFLPEQFKEQHVVSAVASSGGFAMAIVDGVWMSIGQSLDGCALVRVSGETAVFDCFGENVELSVETVVLSDGTTFQDSATNLKTPPSGADTDLD